VAYGSFVLEHFDIECQYLARAVGIEVDGDRVGIDRDDLAEQARQRVDLLAHTGGLVANEQLLCSSS